MPSVIHNQDEGGSCESTNNQWPLKIREISWIKSDEVFSKKLLIALSFVILVVFGASHMEIKYICMRWTYLKYNNLGKCDKETCLFT